jgi:hypothetical protein
MQQLQKAGLSLAQIFKAAIINNARKFKIDLFTKAVMRG